MVRKVTYEERARPTLIRDPTRDEDQFAQGTLLLDEETGAVLRTELRIDNARARTQVTVDYRWVAALELWLPGEMTESYEGPGEAAPPPERPGGWAASVDHHRRTLRQTPPLRGHHQRDDHPAE